MKTERRIAVSEIRAEKNETDQPKIVGYAAVFNKLSEDLGGFREKIAPGAFRSAIDNSDTRALFNHDSSYVLGRKSAGTLKIEEDDNGLRTEILPPDTQWARDLMVSIDRGDISQMSFGFRVSDNGDTWEKQGDTVVRTLTNISELFDVSPVTFPAYPDTTVAMRSMEEYLSGTPTIDPVVEPTFDKKKYRERVIKIKKNKIELEDN